MLDLAEELKAAAAEGMQLPSLCVDPAAILAVMVNEVVPECPENDFTGTPPRRCTCPPPCPCSAGAAPSLFHP